MPKQRKIKPLTAAEFDAKAEHGEDLYDHFDFTKVMVFRAKRVNVDFPQWMVDALDHEAVKLNVSRQAVIKMWIRERLDPHHRITR